MKEKKQLGCCGNELSTPVLLLRDFNHNLTVFPPPTKMFSILQDSHFSLGIKLLLGNTFH